MPTSWQVDFIICGLTFRRQRLFQRLEGASTLNWCLVRQTSHPSPANLLTLSQGDLGITEQRITMYQEAHQCSWCRPFSPVTDYERVSVTIIPGW
ncbi:hypothetical protein Y032_0026g1369 [Ancylostoma ceylanicum]|uniref:Uncharacterized protein n=1 Tax=Ancylostoma ceylanicum TaxID=53326 RepID=A0A016UUY6_9BILA|nr:hypothetical protein Y032_0026g1369 [Ancylostoma ceylanicum]